MCLIRRWLAELTLPDIFLAKVQAISIDRHISNLSNIPYQTYLATGDVTVEIPSLGIKIPVVGVPKKNGTWNVSWLGTRRAGWWEAPFRPGTAIAF